MIADLKADSARWEQEVARRADMGYSRGTYVQDIRRSRSPNTPPASYASSSIHEMRQQGGPAQAPPAFNPPPNQYNVDPYQQQPPYGGHPPQHYGQTPAYTSSQSPGFPQNAYASPPQQNPYPGQNPPPISAAESHPAYTYTGQPVYPYEGRNAAPRYPGYENEPDYPNVSSSMGGYPPASTASDARAGMEARYTPEAYPDHRPGVNRPQQSRDPHRRPR